MKRFELFPPLAEIEQRIFGISEGLIKAVKSGQTSARIAQSVIASPEWEMYEYAVNESGQLTEQKAEIIQSLEMPLYLKELIQRRVSATESSFSRTPTPGQIVEVLKIVTPRPNQVDWVLQVPLYVLLDAEAESKELWHGWLVTSETDYASTWDFVLQEQDEPFDPEAGMVQVWNPVRIYLPMAGRPVAELRLERLQAVRALAAEFLLDEGELEGQPKPGRVAIRETTDSLRVTTGSPVGTTDDPRIQYQRIYFHAAEAIREPARLALAELSVTPNPIHSLLRNLIEAGRAFGEDLLLVPRLDLPMSKEVELPLPSSDLESDFSGSDSDSVSQIEAEAQDIVWGEFARIRVLDAQADGSAQLMIIALNVQIAASLYVDGQLIDKTTALTGVPSPILSWEGERSPELVLETEMGHKLQLRLSKFSQVQT